MRSDMEDWNRRNVPRPADFAAYIAASACFISSMAVDPSSGK